MEENISYTETNHNEKKLINIEELNKAIKELGVWHCLSLKERTLLSTNNKYDTIFYSNNKLLSLLIEKYGMLNYVYIEHLCENHSLILFNSSKMNIKEEYDIGTLRTKE